MANKYNPQIKIELLKLETDGSESPMDIEIVPADLNNHKGNKPILVECSITKALGSTQQSATVTLHNAPVIEEIRTGYQAYLGKIRDQNWRIKIWAWWSDSADQTQPEYGPIFIGDIYDEVSVQSQSVNDSSITLKANGHDFIMRSGKYRTEFEAETTYLDIVNNIFEYFISIGYGPKIVIQDSENLLGDTVVERTFIINRNPTETLNDFCRQLDFYWGVDAKTLYFLRRKEVFGGDQLPEIYANRVTGSFYRTGMTSLVNFSKYNFSFSNLWENEYSLGKPIFTAEVPQLNFVGEGVRGRINSLNMNLNNYTGHKCNVVCQYLDEAEKFVVLPPQRDDSSGRR